MDQQALADLYLKTLVSVENAAGSMVPAEQMIGPGQNVHVITAWNPGDERPTPEENAAANDRLRGELLHRGLFPRRAIGSDPSSDHYEESWAVVGLRDDEARSIGAAFGQIAVFRIQQGSQTVLSCEESWTLSRRL